MATQVFKDYEEFKARADKSINGVSLAYDGYEKDNETNIGCWDCTECQKCRNCQDCYNCYRCHNNYNCRHCRQCYHCHDCYDCTDCRGCNDCRHITFYTNNVRDNSLT